MKISELLKKGFSVSFEVFPAKANTPVQPVKDAVARLAKAKPSFISVTYGAAGGANTNTADLASFVQNECGVTALAHLTCLNSSRERISDEVAALRRCGIENVLCLRGDVPAGGQRAEHPEFAYAVDLVKALRPSDFCLGGACYPECHPECEHLEVDIAHLKEKVDAGLDFVTTQMFFDNNVFYRYLSRLRAAGVTVPVIPGIMPVTNGRQISRICKLSGTYLPQRFAAIVDRFGGNPDQMMDAGVAYATEQIIDLMANGIPAVHVYTMNKPVVGERIMANLASILAG